MLLILVETLINDHSYSPPQPHMGNPAAHHTPQHTPSTPMWPACAQVHHMYQMCAPAMSRAHV